MACAGQTIRFLLYFTFQDFDCLFYLVIDSFFLTAFLVILQLNIRLDTNPVNISP